MELATSLSGAPNSLGQEGTLISKAVGSEKSQVKCKIFFITHLCIIYMAISHLIIYSKEIKLCTKI